MLTIFSTLSNDLVGHITTYLDNVRFIYPDEIIGVIPQSDPRREVLIAMYARREVYLWTSNEEVFSPFVGVSFVNQKDVNYCCRMMTKQPRIETIYGVPCAILCYTAVYYENELIMKYSWLAKDVVTSLTMYCANTGKMLKQL